MVDEKMPGGKLYSISLQLYLPVCTHPHAFGLRFGAVLVFDDVWCKGVEPWVFFSIMNKNHSAC
jgi:hypothetical protein